MLPAPGLDVQDVIDARPVPGFQQLVIALCFPVVAIDGFDTAAIGFIISAQLAPLLGACFGPLVDRYGRRPVLPALLAAAAMFTTGLTVHPGPAVVPVAAE